MNLTIVDDIRTCCETTHSVAPLETTRQADSIPENQADLTGSLDHYPRLPSNFIAPRNVNVWLPPNYEEGDTSTYNVLYMHDGQNLFEAEKSYIGVDWGMDQTMAALCLKEEIRPTIVVGIWNTPKRMCEYLPQRSFCDYQSPRSRRRVVTGHP